MRIFYSLLLYLLTPWILLRLLWRSRYLANYRRRIAERFGFFEAPAHCENTLWIHAVSVGEVIAATPLIKRLKQIYAWPIVITTMTPTGSEQVQKHFANFSNNEIFHVYAPYDLPDVVLRFLNKVNPRIAIMMETELWPNILYYCRQKHIPTIVANARLSDRSAQKYAFGGSFVRAMLANISMVIAQSQDDAKRYMQLGLDKQRVVVTGSVKFDLQLPASLCESAEILRQQWGGNRPVWIAASTHEGEEEIVLTAFKEIRQAFPQTLLVLVPRHPERFARVNSLCVKHGFSVVTRSSGIDCSDETAIFLGDSIGELILFYAAADIAFVGGSLSPIGGHNLLEPAAVGIPVIIGPHMFNFVEITRLLKEAGALIQITDATQLAQAVFSFLQDASLRAHAGEKGKEIVEKNRGAVEKHLEILQLQLQPAIS